MNYNVVRANHNRTALNQKTIFPSFRPPPLSALCVQQHLISTLEIKMTRYAICVCVCILLTTLS